MRLESTVWITSRGTGHFVMWRLVTSRFTGPYMFSRWEAIKGYVTSRLFKYAK